MTVETIDDIDVQLAAARLRWLHRVWDEQADGVTRAQSDINRLLERRYVLRHATVADPDLAAAASDAREDSSCLDLSPTAESKSN